MNTQRIDAGVAAGDTPPTPMAITVARGNLYLSRELYDRHLHGTQSIALLERDGRVMIVPLTPESGGGLLLKIRNVRGDRVIHAQEFFREKGFLEDFGERTCAAHWSERSAALVIADIPRS